MRSGRVEQIAVTDLQHGNLVAHRHLDFTCDHHTAFMRNMLQHLRAGIGPRLIFLIEDLQIMRFGIADLLQGDLAPHIAHRSIEFRRKITQILRFEENRLGDRGIGFEKFRHADTKPAQYFAQRRHGWAGTVGLNHRNLAMRNARRLGQLTLRQLRGLPHLAKSLADVEFFHARARCFALFTTCGSCAQSFVSQRMK